MRLIKTEKGIANGAIFLSVVLYVLSCVLFYNLYPASMIDALDKFMFCGTFLIALLLAIHYIIFRGEVIRNKSSIVRYITGLTVFFMSVPHLIYAGIHVVLRANLQGDYPIKIMMVVTLTISFIIGAFTYFRTAALFSRAH